MRRTLLFLSLGLLTNVAIIAGACAATPSGERFESPDAAVGAVIAAIEKSDTSKLEAIFGHGSKEALSSGDPVADTKGRQTFLNLYQEQHSFDTHGEQTVLVIGDRKWPFPIPLVQHDGRWQFDTASGKEELINRRIGDNELNAIDFCRQYLQMQQTYFSKDRDGDGFQEYATRFMSDRGRKNGLFWFRGPYEEPSPLGPIAAQAFAEGYLRGDLSKPQQYHGYYFSILTAQGAQAPGGAKSYIGAGGRMTGGFALLAYPARWGNSGIMSFMVAQDGKVLEKNLGPRTGVTAAAMRRYDPDPSWTPAK